CDYPSVDRALIDPELEARMQTVRKVVALGRKLREDHRIKVRQPLQRLTFLHRDPSLRAHITRAQDLVADELNVKEVAVDADESAFTNISVKPIFKTLGKRCGPKLKQITPVLASWGSSEIARLEAGEALEVAGEALSLDDVILQRQAIGETAVATDGQITVVLDTHLTPALKREGHAREFISLVQGARKDAGLEVTDRIRLSFDSADAELMAALTEHRASILRETLAVALDQAPGGTGTQLNGIELHYTLRKADAGG